MDGPENAELERDDIQGFVMSGYAAMHEAAYLLLGWKDREGPRRWLADLAPRLTPSVKRDRTSCLHVALTAAGLRALGVTEEDVATFPVPFREGMAAEHRTRILGDTGASHPKGWDWGGPSTAPVHAVLLLFAQDEATFAALEKEERGRLTDAGVDVVHRVQPRRLPGRQNVSKFGVEHFGFADGMSQPVIRGSGQEGKLTGEDARRDVIAAGEFVLGYPNAYGKLTPLPKLASGPGGADFGRNGSYLVVRQLAQDVAAFRRFLREQSSTPEELTALGAKIVGRWPGGAPLVTSPDRDDPELGASNSFGYATPDPHGLRCPIAAHIRRTNPRDSLGADPEKALELANRHRILRRGRVFGPDLDEGVETDDGEPRGLVFMCLNANLERQFEFIQHTWCNDPKFAGRYDEEDPLIATRPEGGGRFTIQERPVRRRLTGIPEFVTTSGGAYFFLPGVRAVARLGSLT